MENYDDDFYGQRTNSDSDTSNFELNDSEDDSDASVEDSDVQSTDNDVDEADNADNVAAKEQVSMNSITGDEIRAMEFGTVSAAYDFYYRYGKCKGFSVRKGHVRMRNGSEGRRIVSMKQFLCSKQGYREVKHIGRVDRKREHRRLTRTNCTARLRVHYNAKKNVYEVSVFEECHNHELTPSKYVHLHPVYRKISESDKAQIDALQSRGIRTCHIIGYMVAQNGGYEGVGFTKKDLYNYFDKKMRRNIKDGDVAAALNYLNVKSSTDPMLFAKYTVNSSDGRLHSLFWADGSSRSDYFCFGDVLAFDATYKKNKYNYPLVIFSGCNHHSQTVIFGAAIVYDELKESYRWLLQTFLECMEGKQPKAVVTDGDLSMKDAINFVFPDATHRLCAWHLNKNANDNVKNSEFLEGFKTAMYSNFTTERFEEFWSELITETGLEAHPWILQTYSTREMWAAAYLRDRFFGRLRTTSQCEAVNAIIKSYVRKKGCIFEFMHNFYQAMTVYRNNEVVADFKSKFSQPVLITGLKDIERDAAKVFTAEIFKDVRDQIIRSCTLIVKDKYQVGGTKYYTLTRSGYPDHEREVVYDGTNFECSCRLFDSRGLPCSHIFYVMKEESVSVIPTSLVLSRWTKDAKLEYLNSHDSGSGDSTMIELARFGAYCSVFTNFCKDASKKDGVYGAIMEDILNLRKKHLSTDDHSGNQNSGVGDPLPVKSKGAPKKKKNAAKAVRRCSKCKSTTHNARSCLRTTDATDEPNVELDSASIGDTVDKTNKNKRKCSNGESSVQRKSADPPQNRHHDVSTTPYMGLTPTHIHPMYGVQPMYPIYGMPMHFGESSNSMSNLLRGMMKDAGGKS